MKRIRVLSAAILGALSLAGCGAGADQGATSSAEAVTASAASAAPHLADTECRVVLRTAKDTGNSSGDFSLIFNVTVDVDQALTDQSDENDNVLVGVQWRALDGSSKAASRDAVGTLIDGAPAGFRRYSFDLDHDTFDTASGDSTELDSFMMSVIPFLRVQDGTTYYDHNRISDPLGSYILWSGDTAGGLITPPPNAKITAGFQVKNDTKICRSPAPRN